MTRWMKILGALILAVPIVSWYGEHAIDTVQAARNGSGTYSVPHTATSGSVISSSDWNDNFSDVGNEITNSLPRDGQAGMTGQFKAASGTTAAPGISFTADTDTGFYRSGSGQLTFTSNGVDVFTMDGNGISTVPPGSVEMYAGSSTPSGWLVGNGAAVSRTTYANLFTAIGTTYGTGDGSTTFNLPDCTGRVLAGKESSATRLTSGVSGVDGGTLGATGGAQSFTLAAGNIPSLSLGSLTGSVGTSITNGSSVIHANTTNTGAQSGGSFNAYDTSGTGTTLSLASGAVTFGGSIGAASPSAKGFVQPTIVLNCLIKF